MATVYHFDDLNLSTGIPYGIPGGGGFYGSDGYMYLYNYGPFDIIVNPMASTSSPVPPDSTDNCILCKRNEWTKLPADVYNGPYRSTFLQLPDISQRSDGVTPASTSFNITIWYI